MANYYLDNPDLQEHLDHPLFQRVVELVEEGYREAERFDSAPFHYEDALDGYRKVLEIVGEISGDIIQPHAASVDEEGPRLEHNRVHYAPGTVANLESLRKAGLMGLTLPRRHGGLNFPTTIYCMAVELVSRADASLMNIFGLQDIGQTVREFAGEEVQDRFLPRFASGEATGAMILTEPDAGSDLQAVKLRAHVDADGTWRLNGVKRFITNGNAELSLVLARSEEGTQDGRGLSMFLYERDETVQIRRIEEKMGIHGSPTCEMVFRNSPAILIGKRKFGLIRYVMALMNGARLGIGCQSVGLSEAAYREALKYARERQQFGKPIDQFPAVYEMLSWMQTRILASRALLYETARFVDVYKALEEKEKKQPLSPEEREEMKKYRRLADLFTPLLKGISSEYCNQIAYDAVQIHGGTGFMKDFPVERLYRDARITTIYEGTTQLQVVAAIRGVTSGVASSILDEYEAVKPVPETEHLHQTLVRLRRIFEEARSAVEAKDERDWLDYHARRLVEMAGNLVMGHLLVHLAGRKHAYLASATLFLKQAETEILRHNQGIKLSEPRDLGLHKAVIQL